MRRNLLHLHAVLPVEHREALAGVERASDGQCALAVRSAPYHAHRFSEAAEEEGVSRFTRHEADLHCGPLAMLAQGDRGEEVVDRGELVARLPAQVIGEHKCVARVHERRQWDDEGVLHVEVDAAMLPEHTVSPKVCFERGGKDTVKGRQGKGAHVCHIIPHDRVRPEHVTHVGRQHPLAGHSLPELPVLGSPISPRLPQNGRDATHTLAKGGQLPDGAIGVALRKAVRLLGTLSVNSSCGGRRCTRAACQSRVGCAAAFVDAPLVRAAIPVVVALALSALRAFERRGLRAPMLLLRQGAKRGGGDEKRLHGAAALVHLSIIAACARRRAPRCPIRRSVVASLEHFHLSCI